MKIGPFSMFDGDAFMAWHWKWSITWSWIISLKRHRYDTGAKPGFYWIPTHGGKYVLCGWNNRLFDIAFRNQPTISRVWPF